MIKYAVVPAINGIPQTHAVRILQGISVQPDEAFIQFEGEIEEGWVEISQETFETLSPPTELEPIISTEERLIRLEGQNLILMDALATTFEEVLALRAIIEGGSV